MNSHVVEYYRNSCEFYDERDDIDLMYELTLADFLGE